MVFNERLKNYQVFSVAESQGDGSVLRIEAELLLLQDAGKAEALIGQSRDRQRKGSLGYDDSGDGVSVPLTAARQEGVTGVLGCEAINNHNLPLVRLVPRFKNT